MNRSIAARCLFMEFRERKTDHSLLEGWRSELMPISFMNSSLASVIFPV